MASLQAFVPNAVGAPPVLVLSPDSEPMRLDSLCVACMKNGVTTLLMTKIPFFREVVLMSFDCQHCGFRSSEVQMGGLIPDRGVHFELRVEKGDVRVVKGDTCTCRIPELDLEIPPHTQRGTMTTVEGVLAAAARDLRLLQEERRGVDAALADQLDAFCARLDSCAAGEEAFTLELDDPAGNSALEWYGDWEGGGAGGASSDPALKRRFYERTRQQNVDIGCMSEETMAEEEAQDAQARKLTVVGAGAPKLGCSIVRSEGTDVMAALGRYSAPEEVMVFPGGCPDCAAEANTRMFATNIPYFRQVVVMCTSCDACGYRNSELRSGGEIPPLGRTTTLRVNGPRDLGRDVIKSETSDLSIPEIDLELGRGTLGGRVTTVEGLLTEVRDALQRTRFTTLGDSAVARERGQWADFYSRLEACIQGETPFTLVLRDPLAGCFISASTEDWTEDKQLSVEDFARDWEEDEEFGLHDMDVRERDAEGHAEPEEAAAPVAA